MTTNRIRLACPECFADPGAPCDRCGGRGTINAVLPDGGAPPEMEALIAKLEAKKEHKLLLTLSAFVAVAVILVAVFADRIF